MKLTKSTVEKLEVTGKRYNAFDDDLKGFAVRVGTGGDKAFYYVYRAGKGRGAPLKWVRIGSFPTLTVEQARMIAKEMAASVALGADPALEVKEGKTAPTVKDAFETFFVEHVQAKLKASSITMYRSLSDNNIFPAIGKLKVEAVEHRHIALLHHTMKDTPYQANRAYACLHKFFAWAEKNGFRVRGTNPASGIEKYKERKRTKFMDKDTLSRIGAALSELEEAWNERESMRQRGEEIPPKMAVVTPQSANVIRLLALSGARLGEVISLKWEYLDLDAGLAHLPDSKTDSMTTEPTTKTLHLPLPAVELLSSMEEYSAWVFPSSIDDGHARPPQHAWRAVCKKAGLSGWRIHDLRHAFASAAVNSGYSLPQIGALLGHTQASTTQRYAHVAQNPVHAVAEDVGAQVAAALNTKPKRGKVLPFKEAQG